ncbi:adenylyl-sulfate kinase, partial [Mangrovactinospora gilvigrisea]|uniref:adenylyl-sulfate kinase n=1 Tax=Mangrovactinospora gilvigrisea TaxID=1428644 RepID=UPI000AF9F02D
RARHADADLPYLEVHVATPGDACAARDVKGLYARQRAGELTGLTGVDAPYEAPARPEARLDTTDKDVRESADEVYTLLAERELA